MRRNLRSLARARLSRRRPGPPPEPPAPPAPAPRDWRERELAPAVAVDQPVTQLLYERLLPEDVAAVEAALENGTLEAWEATPEPYRAHLVLCFGVWSHIPGVLERTGLVPAEPPPEVHAMARGPLAAGGDLNSADLVVDALARAGRPIASVRRALDLGCSSGRTVRVLAAAYPDTEWHGVDPNGPAIEWAARYVPGVSFMQSASDPPLPFPDGRFDLVFAISIWSHFSEPAALRWLDEMHRVLEPGGHLVLTMHGAQSVAYYSARGERPPEQADAIVEALQRRGFWFAQEFGEEGDHGVAHPDWGTAFMSAEWLLRHVTPRWQVASYEVGRNADNQDVAVLRRC